MTKKYLAEFIGTFAIVFFGCGSMISLAGAPGAHLMVNVVFGLTVAASICALGHISSAHFNPAVTLAFAAAKHFPLKSVPGYLAAQFAGGITASALHGFLLGPSTADFGVTMPVLDLGRALAVEGLLTFFLMLVITSVATDTRVNGAIPAFAIGAAVLLCGLFGGPLTGCSMNPARSLGPALFAGTKALASLWIYIVGPIVGAIFAALLYERLRE